MTCSCPPDLTFLWQPHFDRHVYQLEKKLFVIFSKSLDYFKAFLFVLIIFEPILDGFLKYWKNPEIQDGGPLDGPHSDMITYFSQVISSPHDADAKGHIFRRTIYPPSLAVIAFIFSELRRGIGGGGGREEFPPVAEDRKSPV